MRELLRYVDKEDVTGNMSRRIETRVQEARNNERMRRKYMTWEWELAYAKRKAAEEGLEEGRREGREVGLTEGRAEGRETLIAEMLKDGFLSLDQAEEVRTKYLNERQQITQN